MFRRREAQIKSMQRHNPVIRTTNAEKSHWQLGLQLAGSGKLLMVNMYVILKFEKFS